MPKKKTKKAAAKRIKVTSKGKLVYMKGGRGHLLSGKSRKRKRHLRAGGVLDHVESKRMKSLLSV
ncbi:MAG: 50S ribosomal protein L35 [bacterium]